MTTTAPLRAAASEPLVPTQSAAAHLNPENLDRAQRALVAKAIAEFSHERLLRPVPDGDGWRLDGPVSSHRFRARRFALDHWVLDAASLTRTVDERPAPLDVQALVAEFADLLGLPPRLLPTYLEELAATLAAACWKLDHQRIAVQELIHADHQVVEGAMSEGHPAFVANK